MGDSLLSRIIARTYAPANRQPQPESLQQHGAWLRWLDLIDRQRLIMTSLITR